MQFLKVKIFEDHVLHAISTRDGGVSSGPYKSLDLRLRGGDIKENVKKNYEIFSKKIGFDLKNVAIAHQEHTDEILSEEIGLSETEIKNLKHNEII